MDDVSEALQDVRTSMHSVTTASAEGAVGQDARLGDGDVANVCEVLLRCDGQRLTPDRAGVVEQSNAEVSCGAACQCRLQRPISTARGPGTGEARWW